jgi:hypothetical protein
MPKQNEIISALQIQSNLKSTIANLADQLRACDKDTRKKALLEIEEVFAIYCPECCREMDEDGLECECLK